MPSLTTAWEREVSPGPDCHGSLGGGVWAEVRGMMEVLLFPLFLLQSLTERFLNFRAISELMESERVLEESFL